MSAIAGYPYYEIGSIEEHYGVYYLKGDGYVDVPNDAHATCLNLPEKTMMPNMKYGCISVGGGSGEKPAMAFHSPHQAVACYLSALLKIDKKNAASEFWDCGAFYWHESVGYCFWSNQMHRKLHEDFADRISEFCDVFEFDSSNPWIVEEYFLVIVGSFLFDYSMYTNKRVEEFREKYRASVETQSKRNLLTKVIVPILNPQPGPIEHHKLTQELANRCSI